MLKRVFYGSLVLSLDTYRALSPVFGDFFLDML